MKRNKLSQKHHQQNFTPGVEQIGMHFAMKVDYIQQLQD